jgi:hypothetical protein
MTKTPARSAKNTAGAQMKGRPSVSQPTRPLPEVDERLVASWPVGPERAMARNAYRLILFAGAALEELLADDAPAPVGRDAEIMRAATALTQIRTEDAPTSSHWRMEADHDDDEPVTLEGALYEFEHPEGFDLRDAMRQWAEVTSGTVAEKTVESGDIHLKLTGTYMGVPVEMSAIIHPAKDGES